MAYVTLDDFWPPKDPQSNARYGIDLSGRMPATDTIASIVWTPPEGIVKGEQSHSGQTATVFFAGGTAGQLYQVDYAATTTQGETLSGTMVLPVIERKS